MSILGERVTDCYSCEHSDETLGLVANTKHHRLVIVNDQLYLGRAALIARRHIPRISEMSIGEQVDWTEALVRYEKTCIQVFGATHLTVANLNNHGYREGGVPHVHSHLRPRYAEPIGFAGLNFEDPNPGDHHLHGDDNVRLVSEDVIQRIAVVMKDGWDSIS